MTSASNLFLCIFNNQIGVGAGLRPALPAEYNSGTRGYKIELLEIIRRENESISWTTLEKGIRFLRKKSFVKRIQKALNQSR
jgi:hypothetical protein